MLPAFFSLGDEAKYSVLFSIVL